MVSRALKLLRKLARSSPEELRVRGAQLLHARQERWGLSADTREPSDAEFAAQLATRFRQATPDALREHFASRSEPAFFAGVRTRSAATALQSPEWESARTSLITAAERVVAGHYDLLGYTDLDFGTPVDWHLDPVSGKRGPDLHWSRIPYLDASRFGDHKVIWEINRHQHFMVLGRAYQLTGDARYADCFASHVSAWMDANPPKRGINWASSLEVSYRAIAWLWAIELFRDAPQLTPMLLARMLKLLRLHARHLEDYLSTYFSPNTHLTGEALGLLYLGTLLPELREAARWREHGWQVLTTQVTRQILEDGVYFEQATYYHRYTADIFLHAVLLARVNGVLVPRDMLDRLALGVQHLADITRPDGTIPIIGDDDGGRLVALEQRGFSDVRAALSIGAVVLERPELAGVARRVTEEVLWILGADGARAAASSAGALPSHTSRLAAVGGYAVMRDGWGADALHAVIDCGPLGALNCGHAHADALAVELWANGSELLVDPGTFSYTGSREARDLFRHSAMHNSVTINGEASSVPAGPFSWQHRADAMAEQWWHGAVADRLVGSHPGFARLGIGASHRRAVWFVRGGYWVLVDTVTSTEPSEATAHFHLPDGAGVTPTGKHSAEVEIPCEAGSRRLIFCAVGDVEPILWDDEWVSPAYGIRHKAPAARLASRGAGERQLISVLCPVAGASSVVVQPLRAEWGRAIAVDRPSRYDQLLFAADGQAQVGGAALRGEGAVLCRDREGGTLRAITLFGAQARLEVDGAVFVARGAAEAVWRENQWHIMGDGQFEAAP